MNKKNVSKLINEIDVNHSFDDLNSNINYDKYINQPKKAKKNRPVIILTTAIASMYVGLLAFISIDYASCQNYNKKLQERTENLFSVDNVELYKIDNQEEYNFLIKKEAKPKTSIIEKFANSFSGFNKDVMAPGYDQNTNGSFTQTPVDPNFGMWEDGDEVVDEAPGASSPDNDVTISGAGGNSYLTNTQNSNIDEADVSKCDGTYIYALSNNNFTVYNLDGEKIVNKNLKYTFNEMYVKEQSIILVGRGSTEIYNFSGINIKLCDSFTYENYLTSRVYEDSLILISRDKSIIDETLYENECDVYYDGCTNINYTYSLINYNLTSYTYSMVKDLNSYDAHLYTSENHIYLASNTADNNTYYPSYYTIVSIFDYDLNAIGVIRAKGSVLNQFSMDEYNNYFRIVTTDRYVTEEAKLNAVAIYSLDDLSKVGCLDEGIGEEYQLVKSVRFEKDRCYVVTYRNTDPLYELDLSDVTNPQIVSIYKAPGYSNYLHTFNIDNKDYLFGIGYYDDLITRKISIYENDEYTSQIGSDFYIGLDWNLDNDIEYSLVVNKLNYDAFENHKALFVYNDGEDLFLGLKVSYTKYVIFKVDVDAPDVVSIYKEIDFTTSFIYSRCYLVNGNIYITGLNELHIESFK